MLKRLTTPLLLGLFLSGGGLMACGDSAGDSDASTGDTTGDGDGDGDPATGDGDGDPTTGDGDGDPTTGDGDGDPTTGDGDGDPTTGDGDGDPACMVWEITYDLEGSEFEISNTPLGAGDQVNTLTEPYDADDHVGPGTFVLRFNDVDGAPGGNAYVYTYDMVMDFTVSSFNANVHTNLTGDAGPTECGITSATLEGTNAPWQPPAIVDHHSMGEILCNGGFCGLGGLPDGEPVPVDEISDHPLNPFQFNDDFSSFMSDAVVVQTDDNSTTEWTFMGVETNRELVPGDACLCQ